MQLTLANAIKSAQHHCLHHRASKHHSFSKVYNNVTRGRVDIFMTDMNISPHTFRNKLHTLHWQLIKEHHNFFKHLIISYFTHLVVIWNMPSKQPYQLVFNCTWEDQWNTMHSKLPPFLMLIRLLVLIYVSGRAASLLQSHFNDSLRWQTLQKTKPQQNLFIPTRSHSEEAHCSLLINIAFIPWVLSPHLLMMPFSVPHLFFPVSFRQCESLGFRGAWGQLMSDQRWLFWCQGKQRCEPTQLHCEPKDCVISITHCSFFLLLSSIHPLPCAPPTHW